MLALWFCFALARVVKDTIVLKQVNGSRNLEYVLFPMGFLLCECSLKSTDVSMPHAEHCYQAGFNIIPKPNFKTSPSHRVTFMYNVSCAPTSVEVSELWNLLVCFVGEVQR